jgi:hypothetical protein
MPTPFKVALEYSNTGSRFSIKSKITNQSTYLVPSNAGLKLRSIILVATNLIHTSQSELLLRARETFTRLATSKAAAQLSGPAVPHQANTGHTSDEAVTRLGAQPKYGINASMSGPSASMPSASSNCTGGTDLMPPPTRDDGMATRPKAAAPIKPEAQIIFEEVLAEHNAALAASDAAAALETDAQGILGSFNPEVARAIREINLLGVLNPSAALAIRHRNPELFPPDTVLGPINTTVAAQIATTRGIPPTPAAPSLEPFGPESDQGKPPYGPASGRGQGRIAYRQRHETRRFDAIAADALRMLDVVADQ